MKVFMGVKEYAGFYTNLYVGLKSEAIETDLFLYLDHPFEYGTIENNSRLLNLIKNLYRYRRKSSCVLKKGLTVPIIYILKLILFLQVCLKYDCYILSASSSIFTGLDTLILKFILKKKNNHYLSW